MFLRWELPQEEATATSRGRTTSTPSEGSLSVRPPLCRPVHLEGKAERAQLLLRLELLDDHGLHQETVSKWKEGRKQRKLQAAPKEVPERHPGLGVGAAHVQFSPCSGQSLTWGYEGAPTSAVTEATTGCKGQWPGPK